MEATVGFLDAFLENSFDSGRLLAPTHKKRRKHKNMFNASVAFGSAEKETNRKFQMKKDFPVFIPLPKKSTESGTFWHGNVGQGNIGNVSLI